MPCPHLSSVDQAIPPNTPDGCEDCLKMGEAGNWVSLRLCLTCGHVGCCDSSPHRHATKHFEETGHPIIKAYQPPEGWMWCYVDKKMI